MTYSIVAGNAGTPFDGILNTNDNTYQIITTRDDLTTGGSGIVAKTPVTLTIRVIDFYGQSVDGTVIVNIIQSNRAPVLIPMNFTMNENKPSGKLFIAKESVHRVYGSTVVDISITPPSFKPISLSLLCSSLF